MIPLYKLEKLPRTQQLRKIAKFFAAAENRLCLMTAERLDNKNIKDIYSSAEMVFFYDAVKLLSRDALLSDEVRKALNAPAVVFEQALQSLRSTAAYREETGAHAFSAPDYPALFSAESAHFRRALNNVKHILLLETGGSQADWDFAEVDSSLPDGSRLDPSKRQIFKGMQVYMEDIRSPFNVGAMFRTCESFGVEKIILSPFCADPNHRRAQRTAMGCIDIVLWERQEMFTPSSNGSTFPVFALETGGVPMNEFPFPEKGLLIAGSEELGVSPCALSAADASLGRVSIPCYGAKASLNVSVAFGIAMQAWAQRLGQK